MSNSLRLEQARRKKGISLEQIAESTKISTRFLRAIECEEYEKLPGGIFNTNYIRQYAASVGVDCDELLQRYSRAEASRLAAAQDTIVPVRSSWTLTSVLRWFAPLARS